MTDIELRGVLLNDLYAHRRDRNYAPKPENFTPRFDELDLYSIADQLDRSGLADVKFVETINGRRGIFFARITSHGIDVIEGGATPGIKIELVQHHHNNNSISISNSSGVVVGDNNQQTINNSVRELVKVIDSANATPAQKDEAKGLVRQLLEHPLLASVAGGAIGLLS